MLLCSLGLSMSSFKFNFAGCDDSDSKETKEYIKWLESEEIVPNKQIKEFDQIVKHAKLITFLDVEIGHIVASEALTNITDTGLKNFVELADKEHSDLLCGKYEGGLKIWECTHDLLEYLIKNNIIFKELNVLDLGCGAGILGIYALINEANVTFQDYNKEVLEHVTIPNVLLNFDEDDRDSEIKKCKFFSGDWSSFNKNLAEDVTYDIIITSETIYNENNYEKLIELFIKRLKKDGIIYVAGKTCYFGVGGGMRQFEQAIKNNRSLKYEVCWKNSTGIQREILKIIKQ